MIVTALPPRRTPRSTAPRARYTGPAIVTDTRAEERHAALLEASSRHSRALVEEFCNPEFDRLTEEWATYMKRRLSHV